MPAVMVHDALSFMVLLLIRRFPFRGHPPPPFGFLSLLPSPPRVQRRCEASDGEEMLDVLGGVALLRDRADLLLAVGAGAL